jgi:L-asparaginase
MDTIRIFLTGGTFEKIYPAGRGVRKMTFGPHAVPDILNCHAPLLATSITRLLTKDSLDITDADRKIIALACKRAEESKIIVVHGTDTMIKTAATIASLLGRTVVEKTIVLTGATRPACVTGSDAEFNLGAAIMGAECLPHGVWIVMGGRIFPWNKVRKNKKGLFVSN